MTDTNDKPITDAEALLPYKAVYYGMSTRVVRPNNREMERHLMTRILLAPDMEVDTPAIPESNEE